ncbi:hypothetical protein J6590_043917 [Homalodisca vitripennis]|nr:hypothetical protein J6590_043917 [Homalodisca vitripennis]
MSQYQVDDETASVYSAFLPTRVNAAIQEYFSHKAYLDAQEGFADWFEDYHHARPTEPPTPGPGATFTERVAHDHRLAAYHKELDRWRAAMEHQTKLSPQFLYTVDIVPLFNHECHAIFTELLAVRHLRFDDLSKAI